MLGHGMFLFIHCKIVKFSKYIILYFVCFYREFGLSDEELNEIISGLLKRLEDTDSYIRKRCAWALGELKVSHNSVLLELLPKLVDIDVSLQVYYLC